MSKIGNFKIEFLSPNDFQIVKTTPKSEFYSVKGYKYVFESSNMDKIEFQNCVGRALQKSAAGRPAGRQAGRQAGRHARRRKHSRAALASLRWQK